MFEMGIHLLPSKSGSSFSLTVWVPAWPAVHCCQHPYSDNHSTVPARQNGEYHSANQSKLWVVVAALAYTSSVIVIDTNENQPSPSTAHVHWHSAALADTQPTRLSQLCFVLSGLLLLSLSTCLCGTSTILTMPLSVSDGTHRQATAAQSEIVFAFKPKQRQSRARTDFSLVSDINVSNIVIDISWLFFFLIIIFHTVSCLVTGMIFFISVAGNVLSVFGFTSLCLTILVHP